MSNVRLDFSGKRDSQVLIENLQNSKPEDVDKLMGLHMLRNEAAWHRFVKGAYYHPITWWMGLIQIQMQLGIWGNSRRAQAQLAANQLAQTLKVARDNADDKVLYKALAYNLKHRKADVLGRFAGGIFTNYASTGGKLGAKKLHKNTTRTINLSNFVIATYGAAIKSVAGGHKNIEHVMQSVLTGRLNGPVPYPKVDNYKLSKKGLDIYEKAEGALAEMDSLTKLSPRPVSINEFCLKPENIDLRGLCK